MRLEPEWLQRLEDEEQSRILFEEYKKREARKQEKIRKRKHRIRCLLEWLGHFRKK